MAEQKKAIDVEKEFEGVLGAFEETADDTLIKKASLVADLLTIKTNDIKPWYAVKKGVVADTTEDILYSERVRPGRIVALTHLTAKNSAHVGTTLQLGIERGGETIVLIRLVPSAVNTTVNWDGQVLMFEGDRVKVSHFGATAADILDFSASGYEIKA